MALIACPECGREVSSVANACPSCAYPLQARGGATPQVTDVSATQDTSKSLPPQVRNMSDELKAPQLFSRVVKWGMIVGVAAILGIGLYYNYYVKAENQIRELRADPESVVFKNRKTSLEYFCAEANAKNRMGGYTGYKRVILKKDEVVFFEDETPVYIGGSKYPWEIAIIEIKTKILESGLEKVFREMWAEHCG